MRPDQREFAEGLRLVVIAAVSAVATATLVIGAGRTLLPDAPTPRGDAELVRVVAR